MKVYTRRGDGGETDLFGGKRVTKADPRVCATGDVDELNACLGVASSASDQDDLGSLAQSIQGSLFDLGATLATPDAGHREKNQVPGVSAQDVAELEKRIDGFEGELEPLRRFILPGGTPAAAALHHARTVCRRAERTTVALARDASVDETVIRYLNRLSDLLFVMARVENRRAGIPDVEWVGSER
ncbi:MAG: cob(I)yrinic acid a,c-diamide adenosyltransferase [Myxococcota bacterium]